MASEQLQRLLVLVPWVLRRAQVSVREVCDEFKITQAQLIADLNILFMCGLPGYGPGDLIDAYVDGEEVVIRMADYFAKPLSLTPAEGLLLLCGAEAMRAAGAGSPALESASKRLRDALGPALSDQVMVELPAPPSLKTVRRALARGRVLHITYRSGSKDEATERDVDPYAVFFTVGNWYLASFCRKVRAERLFRVDRIGEAEVLKTSARRPRNVDLSKYEGLYVQSRGDIVATFELTPAAFWVLDAFPVVDVRDVAGGSKEIKIASSGLAWLERLVLRLGPDAKLIAPQVLIDSVRETACRMAKVYSRVDPKLS